MIMYNSNYTELPPDRQDEQQQTKPQSQTPPAQDRLENEGYLELQIKSQTGENVSGAKVQIVRERDNNLMFDLTTDTNGRTRRVTLPTPEVATSYGQTGEVFYTNYMIMLNYPDHSTTIYRSISIYVGSTSVLTLVLYR
jgi:hypothetical protein